MEKRSRAPEDLGALVGAHGSDIANLIAVDVWGDLAFEIGLVLDNPGDDEPPTAATGDLDRFRCAFFGMNAAKEEQAAIRILPRLNIPDHIGSSVGAGSHSGRAISL